MKEMNYGVLLVEFRKKHGISRYRLARKSGLSESTIQNWETGGIEPTVKKYNQALVALGEEITIGKKGEKSEKD